MCFGSAPQVPTPQLSSPSSLQSLALGTSQQNLTSSQALQNQVFPTLNTAQNTGIGAVQNNLNNPVTFNPATASTNGANQLLGSAAGTAQSFVNANGTLPADLLTQTIQQTGESGFQSGLRGSGLANVVGAGVGNAGIGFQQQAAQDASTVSATGQQLQSLQNAFNEFNSQYGATTALQSQGAAQQATGLLTGLALPTSGLTPGDLAGVAVGNVNTENQVAQQNAALQTQQNSANQGAFFQYLGLALSGVGAGAAVAAL